MMEGSGLLRFQHPEITKKGTLTRLILLSILLVVLVALTIYVIVWYLLPTTTTVYSFKLKKPYPDPPIFNFATSVWNDRIYLIGGRECYHSNAISSDTPIILSNRTIYYMNNATSSWANFTSAFPYPVEGLVVKSYKDYLYAFGGLVHDSNNEPPYRSLDTIFRYDIHAGQWNKVSYMPRGRSSHGVGIIGTHAYIIGGLDATPRFVNDTVGTWHSEIDVFDLDNNTCYTTNYTLPHFRKNFTVLEIGNDLVLLGGFSPINTNLTSLVFRPLSKEGIGSTFSTAPLPDEPYLRNYVSAGELLGDIFIFGGFFYNTNISFVYGGYLGGKWELGNTQMSEKKTELTVVKISENEIGLIGGLTQNNSVTKDFEIFEREEKWTWIKKKLFYT